MLEDKPPAAKGPTDWTPLSLFKKMQLKYAKMHMEKGRENLKKWKKEKESFFKNPPLEKCVWWQVLL